MSKRNPKFNHGKKTSCWFPIKQHRYKTEKHPVHLSTERCAAKIRVRLSATEQRIIEGLANILQTTEREAIRIAIYEAARNPQEMDERSLRCGSSTTTEQGYQRGNRATELRLPNSEKKYFQETAKTFRVTDAEFIRTAVIWLAHLIRETEYNGITDSKRIRQDLIAEAWRNDWDGSPSKIQGVRDAKKKNKETFENAYIDVWERQEELNKQRSITIMEHGGMPWIHGEDGVTNWECVDAMTQIDQADFHERKTEGMDSDELLEYWQDWFFDADNPDFDEAEEVALLLAKGQLGLLDEEDS